jgi:cytochrome c-type biogenesis protein CcmH/NrfG
VIWDRLSDLLAPHGRVEEAIEAYRELLRIAPRSADLY